MAINESALLELMISSRSRTEVRRAARTVRRAEKKLKSLFTVGDQRLFDEWIHGDQRHRSLDANWYQTSERRAGRTDVFIVLFTGDSGAPRRSDAVPRRTRRRPRQHRH